MKNSQLKEKIKETARKKTIIGRSLRFAICFVKEGPKEAFLLILNHFQIKHAESEFIRTELNISPREEEKQVKFPREILFSILVPLYNTPQDFLKEMIRSVQDQTYPDWELCLADGSDDAHESVGKTCRRMAEEDPRIRYRKLEENLGISGNTNKCIEMAKGDYIVLFDHDDLLHPSALYENMKAICEQGADFIYSDEVVFLSPDKTNLIATHFKPDFAPDNLLSNNYICHLSVFRRELLDQAGWFRDECNGSQDHDIILRLTGCAEKIVHIPKVLYFWRSHPTSVASDISTKTYAVDAGLYAVKDFLRTGKQIQADVTSTEAYPTMYHVKYPINGRPKIAVIVDLTGSQNSGKDAGRILAAIRDNTDYKALNIVFISAESFRPECQNDFPVSVVKAESGLRPVRLNQAAAKTDAEYLVFLDRELTALNPDWLEEMLMLAQQDRIGAVGAKLYFDNTRLRHGGLILGFGKKRLVGRSHYRMGQKSAGYFGQLAIVEDVSAVSAECMMIQKTKFNEAGGFPEQYQDTLYDVDLCLKLQEKGYYQVYTPFAELQGGKLRKHPMDYGTESKAYKADAEILREKWNNILQKPDPYYNPNLTLDHPDYRIKRQ